MRIVFVSPNRLLHDQWNKAIENNTKISNIYFEKEIENFNFLEEDIILFDYDNLNEFLSFALKGRVLCLSSKLDNINGFKLLKQGVKGYGNNYMTPMNLKEAIKVIKSDKVWVNPDLMKFIIENSTLSKLVKYDDKIDGLSQRELDVSKFVSKGFTNKEIAQELDITERTIKAHISTIFQKLQIKDRVTLGIMMKEYLNS
ncbi:response regulator transcription factor [Poseidonibacter lekithochrous]|uniref:response regulator transcription factor n=1 Tax=Poseidonibacter TaxID=2321187 RepID=UPI001C0921BD|nr:MULTISPECIES: response regulator transcription factor [Poseidonibacter]MBU3014095.1 response regulator transcription factor [Poseidonibacter lekithochrous]MDO6827393.1 response regulator transcription factor [Poseidonibacter sp. 1_MG-2023]